LGALWVAAASNRGDELFGQVESIDHTAGAVELRELALFFVGARGHGDDVADATEKSNFDGKRIVAREIVEMKIQEQNVGLVLHGEMQSIFEISCNADDVSRRLDVQQGCDESAESSTVIGD